VPPVRLVYTESWRKDWPEKIDLVTFSEENGKTTISLTLLYPSQADRDGALQSGMKDGMEPTFDRPDQYVKRMQ
jgi:uncharacterized protein YndB with AHSA1/START domain